MSLQSQSHRQHTCNHESESLLFGIAACARIVDVVDPKISETVADPCCGTAGFLLAAYEHMRTQSKDVE